MIKAIINGSRGKMGRTLLACVAGHPDITIVGQVDLGDSLVGSLGQADVVLDFSSPAATREVAEWCAGAGKALVIGTTGQNQEDREAVAKMANAIPIVWASNFSIGMNALFYLARLATKVLGPDFDLEVVEAHHRQKKDAPSGSAKTLVEILKSVRQNQLSEELDGKAMAVLHGRQGNLGARSRLEIGVHAIRGGSVVGDHTVIYAGSGERLELAHKVESRETFANGAFLAAKWLVAQEPGLYSMGDVLGLD